MDTMIIRSKKNRNFYKMPAGFGHYFGRLQVGRLWGQISLILFLTRLSIRWAATEPTHPFGLGDLANEDGSPMGDHVSHSTGVGVDIYVINKNGKQRNDLQNLTAWNNTKEYDAARTLKLARLISSMEKDFPLIQFLYNDPLVLKAAPKIPKLEWHDGHDEHMHVLLTGQHPFTAEEVEARLNFDWYYPEY